MIANKTPAAVPDSTEVERTNRAYAFKLSAADGRVHARLTDRCAEWEPTAAPYHYALDVQRPDGVLQCRGLQDARLGADGDTLTVEGRIGGLRLRQRWALPEDQPWMEETLTLTNDGKEAVTVADARFGFRRRIADAQGRPLPGGADDRLSAIPFRKRPDDPAGRMHDYSLEALTTQAGFEMRGGGAYQASPRWYAEAWAWRHGAFALALMKFNQDRMEFSVLSVQGEADGLWLCFGGATVASVADDPALTLSPGASVRLGVTRYQTVAGGHAEAAYAYREWLDARGCRFPAGFKPPVHWNELYDNPEWWVCSPSEMPPGSRIETRRKLYTREDMEAEAVKARAYHCDALYLDPGWDTSSASLQWDEARLGPLDAFVREMRERHDLAVALHTPLAAWISGSDKPWHATRYWPPAVLSAPDGERDKPRVCLGSRQYLDEAEQRLLALCEAGVAFLMFDGNSWDGACDDAAHGHPVPYTREVHIRANAELARRVHARYPDVLIEMHDMLSGPSHRRSTPVYYQYGLPGGYDSNWGFELMWNPIGELRNGQALALYYYNLACNVPVYLHIDLRDDNAHCTFFWWFASLCRHLGIGGTHADPNVAAAQRHAMQRYHRLAPLYQRGEFYGISEEIHIHVLPDENRFVVNIFNITDQERDVTGTFDSVRLGIALDRYYTRSERWCHFDHARGTISVACRLPPWGHQMVEVNAL